MKTLRKTLKLLPPAFAMRIWLERRYGIKVKPSPWRGVAGFALAILPYAFTAALSVREDSDVRLLKYFLPYGKMKKFVRLAYGMQRGDASLDRGAVGWFRSLMPYGLVLWWDAERDKGAPVPKAGEGTPAPVNAKSPAYCLNVDGRISERQRMEFLRMDRIEARTLRVLIMTEQAPLAN